MTTITLPAGHQLTVTAPVAASGSVWPFAERPGDAAGATAIAASGSATFGPFATVKRYQIDDVLTYSATPVDFNTPTEDTAAIAAALVTAAADATSKADAAEAAAIADAALKYVLVVGTVGDVRDYIGADVPAATVAASRTINPAGAENALVYTSKQVGTLGNATSVEYVDPAAVSAALSVDVTGEAITVNLATDAGVKSSLDVNPAGDDNALTFEAQTAGPGGDAISVEYVDPAGNDQPLGVVVVGNAITVNLATGVAGAITSTAAEIKTAIEASGPATALVAVTIDTTDSGVADDGSGVVTAMALANLAGGAWGAITSTAAEVKTAVEAKAEADALVALTFATDGGLDNGSGVVAAAAAAALTGGVNAIGMGVAGIGSRYTDTTNAKLYIQGGTKALPDWKLVTSA